MEEYFGNLRQTYHSFEGICSSFLPQFSHQRFSFCNIDAKPPKKARKHISSFNKIFVGGVYSKIATELENGRHESLVDRLVQKLTQEKPTTSSLHLACALIQMAEDDSMQVGAWLDLSTVQLCQESKFKPQLYECCERMASGLVPKHVEVPSYSLLNAFNAVHDTSLHLPELVFLHVLSLHSKAALDKKLSDASLRHFVALESCNDEPIDTLFVPNFRANAHTFNPLEWEDCRNFFSANPSFIENHDVKVCYFKGYILLVELVNEAMVREAVVSLFWSIIFRLCSEELDCIKSSSAEITVKMIWFVSTVDFVWRSMISTLLMLKI